MKKANNLILPISMMIIITAYINCHIATLPCILSFISYTIPVLYYVAKCMLTINAETNEERLFWLLVPTAWDFVIAYFGLDASDLMSGYALCWYTIVTGIFLARMINAIHRKWKEPSFGLTSNLKDVPLNANVEGKLL